MVAVGDKAEREVERPAKPVPPAPPLPYERGVTISVRGFRLLVVLTLVNTVLLASIVLGPQLSPFVKQRWQQWKDAREQRRKVAAELAAQQKCLTHAEPAGTVAYEEDPEEAKKLINKAPMAYGPAQAGQRGFPPGWFGPVQARPPDYFDEYLRAASASRLGRANQTLLFLHERATPSGAKYLVAVSLYAAQGLNTSSFPNSPTTFYGQKQRSLMAECRPVVTGGSLAGALKPQRRELRLSLPDHDRHVVAKLMPDTPLDPPPPIDYGNRVRFFAGQADPDDPSHFTIAYEIDGRPGTMDGWMRDDGLELKPREGAPTYTAEQGEAWKLPAAALPAGR